MFENLRTPGLPGEGVAGDLRRTPAVDVVREPGRGSRRGSASLLVAPGVSERSQRGRRAVRAMTRALTLGGTYASRARSSAARWTGVGLFRELPKACSAAS